MTGQTLILGNSLNLEFESYYSDGSSKTNEYTQIKCVSEDEDILLVTPQCHVEALQAGVANVSLILLGNNRDQIPLLTQQTINVISASVKSFALLSTSQQLEINQTSSIAAELFLNNDKKQNAGSGDLLCESSDLTIVELQKNCSIKAIAAGEALISVSLIDSLNVNRLPAKTVNLAVLPAYIAEAKFELEKLALLPGDTAQLNFNAIYSDGTTRINNYPDISCKDDGAGVVTITRQCKLTAVKTGTAIVSLQLETDNREKIPLYTDIAVTVTAINNVKNLTLNYESPPKAFLVHDQQNVVVTDIFDRDYMVKNVLK